MLRSVAQQTVTAGGITQLPGQQPELKHSMSTELITIEPTVKQLKQLNVPLDHLPANHTESTIAAATPKATVNEAPLEVRPPSKRALVPRLEPREQIPAEILAARVKATSYRAVEKATGIPRATIWNQIRVVNECTLVWEPRTERHLEPSLVVELRRLLLDTTIPALVKLTKRATRSATPVKVSTQTTMKNIVRAIELHLDAAQKIVERFFANTSITPNTMVRISETLTQHNRMVIELAEIILCGPKTSSGIKSYLHEVRVTNGNTVTDTILPCRPILVCDQRTLGSKDIDTRMSPSPENTLIAAKENRLAARKASNESRLDLAERQDLLLFATNLGLTEADAAALLDHPNTKHRSFSLYAPQRRSTGGAASLEQTANALGISRDEVMRTEATAMAKLQKALGTRKDEILDLLDQMHETEHEQLPPNYAGHQGNTVMDETMRHCTATSSSDEETTSDN